MQARVVVRIAALAAASLCYIVLIHWLMTQRDASPWNVVIVLAPMLSLVAIAAWGSGRRWAAAALALVVAGLFAQASLGGKVPPQWLYLSEHVGFNLVLALFFGLSLRPGRTALITSVAIRVHSRKLSSGHLAYTRQVTAAWAIFFCTLVVVSLGLFTLAGFETWAVFANFVTPVATGVMFGGEYLLRYRLHPEFDRASMAEAIRMYRQGGTERPAP